MAKTRTTSGTFLVGGAVRDELLGREVSDRDWVVVGRTVEAMLAEGYTQVGKDFPVFLHPESHEEYALARTERKTAAGHQGFECHAGIDVTLEEDLQRRDLTVNALATSADGVLIDPYGGEQDLRDGVLRHVSPAFAEDPLRILRVARFAAQLGFVVAPDTQRLMQAMAQADALAELPAERVWQEFHKALGCNDTKAFVQVLWRAGALSPWFAEFARELGSLSASTDLDLSIYGKTPLQRFGSLGVWLGAEAIKAFAARIKAPKRYERFGVAAANFAALLCKWQTEPAADLLNALQQCGALQVGAPERRDDFLLLLDLCSEIFGGFDSDALAQLTTRLAAIGAEDAVTFARAENKDEPVGRALGLAISQLRCAHIELAQAQ